MGDKYEDWDSDDKSRGSWLISKLTKKLKRTQVSKDKERRLSKENTHDDPMHDDLVQKYLTIRKVGSLPCLAESKSETHVKTSMTLRSHREYEKKMQENLDHPESVSSMDYDYMDCSDDELVSLALDVSENLAESNCVTLPLRCPAPDPIAMLNGSQNIPLDMDESYDGEGSTPPLETLSERFVPLCGSMFSDEDGSSYNVYNEFNGNESLHRPFHEDDYRLPQSVRSTQPLMDLATEYMMQEDLSSDCMDSPTSCDCRSDGGKWNKNNVDDKPVMPLLDLTRVANCANGPLRTRNKTLSSARQLASPQPLSHGKKHKLLKEKNIC
eukprot:TRINITY_DN4557_c0_g1_i1.p1 TRINITY_DN4557_c0_g1~~TRINITY_DN4557_c0_g1_i1.p1  ORF type:complete len:326 (+),score=50.95 TRINITY_DN4557_c0_g1_i1:144-1121(+)